MMRVNREKMAAVLALLIFVVGVYSLVNVSVSTDQAIHIKPDPADVQVPPIEASLYLGSFGGRRNPFHMSSEWEPFVPEALPLPPSTSAQEARVTFGWIAARAVGAPIPFRPTALREVGSDGEALQSAPHGEARR